MNKSSMAVVRGWGRANVELFNKHRVSVFQDQKVPEIGCTAV
jgi:hypothetical protein